MHGRGEAGCGRKGVMALFFVIDRKKCVKSGERRLEEREEEGCVCIATYHVVGIWLAAVIKKDPCRWWPISMTVAASTAQGRRRA